MSILTLTSSNRAQACECICITYQKEDCQQHKNLKRAGIAFIPFLFKASIKISNAVSFDLLVYLSKEMSLINCEVAAWKALSRGRAKGTGTDGLVIRPLDD
jgi:hypothetical protein